MKTSLNYKNIKMSLISLLEDLKKNMTKGDELSWMWDFPKRVVFEILREKYGVTEEEQSKVIIRQLMDEGYLYESREGFLGVS